MFPDIPENKKKLCVKLIHKLMPIILTKELHSAYVYDVYVVSDSELLIPN
jgi:hypothetical protein